MLQLKKIVLLLIQTSVVIGLLGGCEKNPNEASPPVPSPSSKYALSNEELKRTIALAEKGNIDAMNRLANFYMINKDENEKGLYWLERAGNAGDIEARNFLLGHYAESKLLEKRKYGEALNERWKTSKK